MQKHLETEQPLAKKRCCTLFCFRVLAVVSECLHVKPVLNFLCAGEATKVHFSKHLTTVVGLYSFEKIEEEKFCFMLLKVPCSTKFATNLPQSLFGIA